MGGRPKPSIEDVRRAFQERGCQLLETEYINHNTPMRYIAVCGHPHKIAFSNFKAGKGDLCKDCRYRRISEKQCLGHDAIKSFFESEGCTVLNDNFRTVKDPVTYIARCGHVNTLDYNHFADQKAGRVCNKCSKSIRYTLGDVQQFFRDSGCELLEPEYKNCKTPLRFRAKCGHESRIDLDHFLNDKTYTKLCLFCVNEQVRTGRLRLGRRSLEMTQWRDAVYKKDNYRCQFCGANRKLNAHHLYSYKGYPELAYDVDNGVTLCRKCHSALHSFYPGITTPQQFQDFKEILNTLEGNTEVIAEPKASATP